MKTIASVELIEYESPDEGTPGQKGQLKITVPPGQTIEALDRLIEKLVRLRAKQQPPIAPPDPVAGQELEALDDPRVHVANDIEGLPLVSFLHPGMGWVSFRLSLASAQFVHQHLAATFESLSRPPGTAQ